MLTPVIIAAYNEAEHIARTLERLPCELEPIVVANGCTDNTAGLAREFGATTTELSDAPPDSIPYDDDFLKPLVDVLR